MTASRRATQFGRSIQAPNKAWLAKQPPEPTLDPDLPVEKVGTGYASLWNAFKRIAARATADEKLALFRSTARRGYRLRDA
jgi:hypothetical protein